MELLQKYNDFPLTENRADPPLTRHEFPITENEFLFMEDEFPKMKFS